VISTTWEDRDLVLKDGTSLRARIWTPSSEDGPWPTLLMRQPYGREIASTITYAHPEWWANQGYLVIVQDVRGQAGSEGQFLGFEQEASDTSETHEWVRSLPECNGLLGTYGFSYQGLTQLLAKEGSRPPECTAPAMTGLNEEQHWSSEGGAFWWHISIAWGLQLAAQKLSREGDKEGWEEIRKSFDSNTYLHQGLGLLQKHDPKGMALKWFEQSNKLSGEWIKHEPLNSWLCKPMLLIGGWWDPHLKGVLEIYEKSLQAGGKPELHIGPASHLQWWEGVQKIHLNFFNRHLKKEKRIKFPTSNKNIWNITTNKWEAYKSFKSTKHFWSLRSNGLSSIDSNDGILTFNKGGEGSSIIVHDPWRPAPSIGGHLSPIPGDANREVIDNRSDVATFTSKPLNKSILLQGIPSLDLFAKSDQESFDLFVVLSIIYKNETIVKQLSTGVKRIRTNNDRKNVKRNIKLQPMSAKFPRGAKIRISIAGAAWPAIAINPGKINCSCEAPKLECLVTTISIQLSQSKLQFFPLVSK